MLADLNSVPLTQLFYHSVEVSLGWKHMGGPRQVALDGNLVLSDVVVMKTSLASPLPNIILLSVNLRCIRIIL